MVSGISSSPPTGGACGGISIIDITTSGYVTGLTNTFMQSQVGPSGLTTGQVYFLNPSTHYMGGITTEEPQIVMSTKGAVELRAIQSRKFDTPDDKKVYRAIIAVMLDLGYAVTSLEPEARTITGNKLAQLTLTATIPASDTETTTVRANAVVRTSTQKQVAPVQVDGAEFYQTRFFDPLAQALFLEALYETEPKELVK